MPESLKPLNHVMLMEPQNGVYTGFQGLVRTEPLGLQYIAGAIAPLDPSQHQYVKDVSIHDDRIQPGGWKEKMKQNPPDMIGIKCNYTADVPIVYKLVKEIREEVGKDIPIVIGGHHISLRPSDVFIEGVDAVAVGPGEEIMRNLITAWEKKRSFSTVKGIWYKDENGDWKSNVPSSTISPLFEVNSCQMNERPWPRRDLVAQYRKMGNGYYFLYYPNVASIESARGCIGGCGFCTIPKFHNRQYHVQSVERTVKEIAALSDDIKYAIFVDDLAFWPRIQKDSRTGQMRIYDPGLELARVLTTEGLQDRIRFWGQIRSDSVYPKNPKLRQMARQKFHELAQTGLDMTLVGFESLVNAGNLQSVKKGTSLETNITAAAILQDEGIRIWAAQIIFPDWTAEDYRKVIEANNKLKIQAPQFTILTPLPGSEDYERAWNAGILTTLNPGRYNFFDWVIPTKLPPERTYELSAELYQETGSSIASKEAIKAALKAGRTTLAALRTFKEIFAKMQNPEAHLANIRRYDPEEEAEWKERTERNRLKYAV